MLTVNFEKITMPAARKYTCIQCDKTRQEKTTITNTVNPFNKNKNGTPKSKSEVFEDVKNSVEEYEKTEIKNKICKTCLDLPSKELLIKLATNPDIVFSRPDRYYDHPISTLHDRGHVENAYHENSTDIGFKITKKGMTRANKYKDFEVIKKNYEESHGA